MSENNLHLATCQKTWSWSRATPATANLTRIVADKAYDAEHLCQYGDRPLFPASEETRVARTTVESIIQMSRSISPS